MTVLINRKSILILLFSFFLVFWSPIETFASSQTTVPYNMNYAVNYSLEDDGSRDNVMWTAKVEIPGVGTFTQMGTTPDITVSYTINVQVKNSSGVVVETIPYSISDRLYRSGTGSGASFHVIQFVGTGKQRTITGSSLTSASEPREVYVEALIQEALLPFNVTACTYSGAQAYCNSAIETYTFNMVSTKYNVDSVLGTLSTWITYWVRTGVESYNKTLEQRQQIFKFGESGWEGPSQQPFWQNSKSFDGVSTSIVSRLRQIGVNIFNEIQYKTWTEGDWGSWSTTVTPLSIVDNPDYQKESRTAYLWKLWSSWGNFVAGDLVPSNTNTSQYQSATDTVVDTNWRSGVGSSGQNLSTGSSWVVYASQYRTAPFVSLWSYVVNQRTRTWGDWTSYSPTSATASGTRQVETRPEYLWKTWGAWSSHIDDPSVPATTSNAQYQYSERTITSNWLSGHGTASNAINYTQTIQRQYQQRPWSAWSAWISGATVPANTDSSEYQYASGSSTTTSDWMAGYGSGATGTGYTSTVDARQYQTRSSWIAYNVDRRTRTASTVYDISVRSRTATTLYNADRRTRTYNYEHYLYSSCANSACGVSSTTYKSCQNSECGTAYNTCANSACGVASYNSCANSACGSYNTTAYGAHSSCGVSYYKSCATSACGNNYCAHSSCGVSSYNTCRTSGCGCELYCNSSGACRATAASGYSCARYKSCANSACGVASYKSCYASACGYKTCQNSACGVGGYLTCTYVTGTAYYSCRTSACGVESYNSCATSACGSYTKTCRTSACGIESQTYHSCRTSACGVESTLVNQTATPPSGWVKVWEGWGAYTAWTYNALSAQTSCPADTDSIDYTCNNYTSYGAWSGYSIIAEGSSTPAPANTDTKEYTQSSWTAYSAYTAWTYNALTAQTSCPTDTSTTDYTCNSYTAYGTWGSFVSGDAGSSNCGLGTYNCQYKLKTVSQVPGYITRTRSWSGWISGDAGSTNCANTDGYNCQYKTTTTYYGYITRTATGDHWALSSSSAPVSGAIYSGTSRTTYRYRDLGAWSGYSLIADLGNSRSAWDLGAFENSTTAEYQLISTDLSYYDRNNFGAWTSGTKTAAQCASDQYDCQYKLATTTLGYRSRTLQSEVWNSSSMASVGYENSGSRTEYRHRFVGYVKGSIATVQKLLLNNAPEAEWVTPPTSGKEYDILRVWETPEMKSESNKKVMVAGNYTVAEGTQLTPGEISSRANSVGVEFFKNLALAWAPKDADGDVIESALNTYVNNNKTSGSYFSALTSGRDNYLGSSIFGTYVWVRQHYRASTRWLEVYFNRGSASSGSNTITVNANFCKLNPNHIDCLCQNPSWDGYDKWCNGDGDPGDETPIGYCDKPENASKAVCVCPADASDGEFTEVNKLTCCAPGSSYEGGDLCRFGSVISLADIEYARAVFVQVYGTEETSAISEQDSSKFTEYVNRLNSVDEAKKTPGLKSLTKHMDDLNTSRLNNKTSITGVEENVENIFTKRKKWN